MNVRYVDLHTDNPFNLSGVSNAYVLMYPRQIQYIE